MAKSVLALVNRERFPTRSAKASKTRRRNLIKIALKGTTIPHEVIGEFGAGSVLLKPAPEGTGVIAGGPVRAVVETAGIKDIRTKKLCVPTILATLSERPSMVAVAWRPPSRLRRSEANLLKRF